MNSYRRSISVLDKAIEPFYAVRFWVWVSCPLLNNLCLQLLAVLYDSSWWTWLHLWRPLLHDSMLGWPTNQWIPRIIPPWRSVKYEISKRKKDLHILHIYSNFSVASQIRTGSGQLNNSKLMSITDCFILSSLWILSLNLFTCPKYLCKIWPIFVNLCQNIIVKIKFYLNVFPFFRAIFATFIAGKKEIGIVPQSGGSQYWGLQFKVGRKDIFCM